jgi:cytoskeletal protein CcmA (bactofilin family)
MRGSLICATVLRIRLKGKLSGSLESKHVIVDKKTEVELVRPLRGELIEVEGIVSARILSSGKVVVKKGGVLRGTVNAKSFLVDRGGEFSGELTIGQPIMVQGDLLKSTPDHQEPDHDSDGGTDFTLAPV